MFKFNYHSNKLLTFLDIWLNMAKFKFSESCQSPGTYLCIHLLDRVLFSIPCGYLHYSNVLWIDHWISGSYNSVCSFSVEKTLPYSIFFAPSNFQFFLNVLFSDISGINNYKCCCFDILFVLRYFRHGWRNKFRTGSSNVRQYASIFVSHLWVSRYIFILN